MLDETYDIVLLDIMMPGIDGYEVCKLIRQKSDIPILFISALSEDENKLKDMNWVLMILYLNHLLLHCCMRKMQCSFEKD